MSKMIAAGFVSLVATAVSVTLLAADEHAAEVQTDRLLIQVQNICPVSGKQLYSMGGPVKAEVGGATVFLCCKRCFGKPLNKEHWSKVQAISPMRRGCARSLRSHLDNNPSRSWSTIAWSSSAALPAPQK